MKTPTLAAILLASCNCVAPRPAAREPEEVATPWCFSVVGDVPGRGATTIRTCWPTLDVCEGARREAFDLGWVGVLSVGSCWED